MDEIFNRPADKQKRRSLRKTMPKAEVLLWSRLRGRQLLGCKFRRQFGVGPFVLDFYEAERLGIELDGESHFEEGAQEYDLRRTLFVEQNDIRLVRFTNVEVFENLDGVLHVIGEELQKRM